MKVARSCLTLCNPMDYSPGNSPGQNTAVGSLSLLRGSSQPRDRTQVSLIADRFFTSWARREAQDASEVGCCWLIVALGPSQGAEGKLTYVVCVRTPLHLSSSKAVSPSVSLALSVSLCLFTSQLFLSLSILLFYLFFCLSLLKNHGFLLMLLIPVQPSAPILAFPVSMSVPSLWETEKVAWSALEFSNSFRTANLHSRLKENFIYTWVFF